MSNWETAATLLASAVHTASGTGTAVDLGTTNRLLRQTLDVTAVSGTSVNLSVQLQSSDDGLSGWTTFGGFTATGAVGSEKLTFISPQRYVRAFWALSGTSPSVTFSVSGTQGTCYANLAQLTQLGIPGVALSTISASDKAEQLASTTEMAAGMLAAEYAMPLVSWGNDLSAAVCKIAAYELLSVRGLNPDGDDSNVRTRYEDGMKWLAAVAAGKTTPVGMVECPTPATPADDFVFIATNVTRGW